MAPLPLLPIEPLTPEAYAPYGDVLMASPRGGFGAPANQGTARRFDRVATLLDLRGGKAPLNVSVFPLRAAPGGAFTVEILEKHPASTQIFVPMNAERFLVLVALGGDRPDVGSLRAFEAHGTQGISYRPGVWHHPMIALDRTVDFACFVHEDGTAGDCEVVTLAEDDRRALEIGLASTP